ncbi:MAG: CPBP family intramembrane metalloprotease, partial [Opitutaceae bacterium]|nr:CPBP family intramembrane metalloprotease [Opitutaceae bacterium]
MNAVAIEISLLASGFLLAGWLCFSKAGRRLAASRNLAPLDATPIRLLQAVLVFMLAACFFISLANALAPRVPESHRLLLATVCFQLGLASGIAANRLLILRDAFDQPSRPRPPLLRLLAAAALVFLLALPPVALSGRLWADFLSFTETPPVPQSLILFFQNSPDLPQKAIFTLLAVAVAPLTEEFIFRGVLYRWLRGRLSAPHALHHPAAAIAARHRRPTVHPPHRGAGHHSHAVQRSGNH